MSVKWTKTSAGIEKLNATDAAHFVECLRASNPIWWENSRCPWVFRGHSNADWPLLPSAWRADNSVISACIREATRRFDAINPKQELKWHIPPNFYSGPTDFGVTSSALSKKLTVNTTAEYILLWEFIERCNELGMPMPMLALPPDPVQEPDWLPYPNLPLVADEMMQFSDIPAALALAQHHRIPTRLLDWTLNPMAAAYFSIEGLHPRSPHGALAVWALHRGRAKGIKIEGAKFSGMPSGMEVMGNQSLAIIRPPTRDNKFLQAQSGLFTTITGSGIYFMKSKGIRPSIERILSEADNNDIVLRHLSLDYRFLGELKTILQRENVARSSLMPTMDNIAADILHKWENFTL